MAAVALLRSSTSKQTGRHDMPSSNAALVAAVLSTPAHQLGVPLDDRVPGRDTPSIAPTKYPSIPSSVPSSVKAAIGIAQGNQITDLMSAGWTDERHGTYIRSLEASFVDQLHNHAHAAKNKDSGTNGFKVLQGGVWRKVEFKRRTNACAQVRPEQRLPESPWIQHFIPAGGCSSSAGGDRAETSVSDRESGIRTIPGSTPLCHGRELGACKGEDLLDESAEIYDRNFADDEAQVDAESRKLSTYRARMIKRIYRIS
ncbi:cold-regulated protein 27-like [Triticum urartu]|uniref:cold-regulated protein 27-like n=1 Tax=Triticum urartu TaxID=4572 RepID=UPI00204373D6|nr:cold-regulated protein 27-like [Triticum urartu]XP_048547282.1 cold-regulated protein 27-like [Triticum urartu]